MLQSSNGIIGARETQQALKFSSPALAVYHLGKLTELGLAEKTVLSSIQYEIFAVVGILPKIFAVARSTFSRSAAFV